MFKDPLEVRRQHETYKTMSVTYVQAISSRKNLTGLAWGLRNGQNMGQKVKIQAFFSFFGWGWGDKWGGSNSEWPRSAPITQFDA